SPSYYLSCLSSLFFLSVRRPPRSTPFPYPTLFRSRLPRRAHPPQRARWLRVPGYAPARTARRPVGRARVPARTDPPGRRAVRARSEEHTSELQSPYDLVCRLLLEKKKLIFFCYISM